MLTKQASKAQRKPSETLLVYLETFGGWVPLNSSDHRKAESINCFIIPE